MDKKTTATFLLCIMAICMMSHAAALGKRPSKASSLVTGSAWGSKSGEITLDGLSLSGGAQTTLLYAGHKRAMKGRGGEGMGRKLKAPSGRR